MRKTIAAKGCVLAVFCLLAMTCAKTSFPTGTRIMPSHFRFATIVHPDNDPKGAGWRAVCIHSTLSQDVAGGPRIASVIMCRHEFGTPIVNSLGPVPLTRAQRVSANVANEAAYKILTTVTPVTGAVCGAFKVLANGMLAGRIRGAKVTACRPGVPVVTFP